MVNGEPAECVGHEREASVAMRDDARRILDDLSDDDMPAVLRLLVSVKARRHRANYAVDLNTDEALTYLVRLSEDEGLYKADYSGYLAQFDK